MAAFESLSQNRSPAVQQRSNAVQENVFEQQAEELGNEKKWWAVPTLHSELRRLAAQNDRFLTENRKPRTENRLLYV